MPSDSDILAEVARALNGSIDVHEALQAVLSTVARHLRLDTGWVWLAEAEEFRLGAAQRLPEGLRRDPDWTEGECWCQSRFCKGGYDDGVELIKCSRLDKLDAGTEGLRYHASLALEAGGERLGIMNLASRDWRELDDDELRLLNAVRDMLSVALARARLYERSSELGALEERSRLSREMHDGVAQTLTALVLRLETLAATGSQDDLDKALDLARAALDDTRDAVMELRASPFGDRLSNGVRLVVRRAELQHSLTIDLDADIRHDPPPRVIHASCRILQEALANVARHSGVSHSRVSVRADSTELTVEVHDDGSGLADEPNDRETFGIIGMRERARLVGARLEVTSDHGTTVRFSWSPS